MVCIQWCSQAWSSEANVHRNYQAGKHFSATSIWTFFWIHYSNGSTFFLIIIKLAVQYAKRQCKPQFTLNCFDQNESSVKRISLLLWFSGHFILMAIHKRRNNTLVYCSSCPHALLVSDSNEHAQFCVSPLISADFQLGPHILVQRLDQSELSPTKFGRIDSAAPPRDH